jgi:hypothetical protein
MLASAASAAPSAGRFAIPSTSHDRFTPVP